MSIHLEWIDFSSFPLWTQPLPFSHPTTYVGPPLGVLTQTVLSPSSPLCFTLFSLSISFPLLPPSQTSGNFLFFSARYIFFPCVILVLPVSSGEPE